MTALADNPHYSMAMLLREALDSGAPPSLARLPMTPEEVAASFDAADSGEEDDDEDDGDLRGPSPQVRRGVCDIDRTRYTA